MCGDDMYIYKRFGRYMAVYGEFSTDLGMKPFFAFKTCNLETIIDLPYVQIILTPGSKLKAEKGHPCDDADHTSFPSSSARAAEDRS